MQSGAFVDTYECVPDYNEQFLFNQETQQIIEMSIGMCLATGLFGEFEFWFSRLQSLAFLELLGSVK
jgi:hypothetical protein